MADRPALPSPEGRRDTINETALWVEQARRLREDQPELWEAAGDEMVGLAEGTIGDGLAGEPWDDQP